MSLRGGMLNNIPNEVQIRYYGFLLRKRKGVSPIFAVHIKIDVESLSSHCGHCQVQDRMVSCRIRDRNTRDYPGYHDRFKEQCISAQLVPRPVVARSLTRCGTEGSRAVGLTEP